jgi:hypothetical protein
MKKFFSLVSLVLILAVFASADIYIKQKMHTDPVAVMGQNQPARDLVSEQWIGDDQFANLSQDQSSIVDLKKNVMYLINNRDKTYVETTLPLDFAKLLPPEMAGMAAAMMKVTVTVNPTGQTKAIGQWNCSGYDVSMSMMMMPMKMQVWATTDVPFDVNKFMEKMYSNVLMAQLRLDEAAIKEMQKVKGFWVASETSGEMMGAKIRSTTEVTEISKKNPPAGVYSVPAGYTKQEKLSMKQMQQR